MSIPKLSWNAKDHKKKRKTCPRCQEMKSESDFSFCSSTKDNLSGYCKKCSSEYNKIHKQKTQAEIKESITKNIKERTDLKHKGVIEKFHKYDVFERDRYICQYCRCKTSFNHKNHLHPKYPSLDHIIPRAKGGDHTMKNTQCLCRKCNNIKSKNQRQDQLLLFGY